MFVTSASPVTPKKIISLVPSITELLFDLGLCSETIAITKFCIHPTDWCSTKEKIGGTKNLQIKKIIGLQPDLIIANKEENNQAQIEALVELFPVYITDVANYEDAIKMILRVGEITSKYAEAERLVENIEKNFKLIMKPAQDIKTAYFIWKDPFMTIGGETFISDMMRRIGLQNIFQNQERYPTITLEDVADASPQLILLSSEPYPFKENHILQIQSVVQTAKILLADGEMFSWYGSRMKNMPFYFNNLLKEIGILHPYE